MKKITILITFFFININVLSAQIHKTYYDNGNLKTIGLFNENEEKSGEWKVYYENGKLKEKANYNDGKLNGEYTKNEITGELSIIGSFYLDRKVGEWRYNTIIGKFNKITGEFNVNVEYSLDIKYVTYKHLKIDELIKSKDFNQTKELVETKFYYEEGQIYSEGKSTIESNSSNNSYTKQGEWKNYHENGKLSSVENYKDNVLIGEWKNYYENGKLSSIGNYKDDLLIGEWKNYYENGKLSSIGNWNNNVKTGKWVFYNENEIIIKTEEWSSEELLDIKNFDLEGKIISDHIDTRLLENRASEINNLLDSNLKKNKLTLITSNEWCEPCMMQLKEINDNNKTTSLFEIYVVDFMRSLDKQSKQNFIEKFPNLDINFIIKNSENDNKLEVIKGVPDLFFVNKSNILVKEVYGYMNIKYIEYFTKNLLK